jgi:hypothetical protein
VWLSLKQHQERAQANHLKVEAITTAFHAASNYTEDLTTLNMPSPRSSRLNLAHYRERAGLRTSRESLAIKRCIWQWGLLSAEHREPETQGELARTLGVRRQYVTRILKRMPFDAPMEMLTASLTTPAHVLSLRQRQQEYRQQQEDQAQRDAENWTAAWQQEQTRVQRGDHRAWSAESRSDSCLDDPQERAWRDEEEEVRRIMFPWLYKDEK